MSSLPQEPGAAEFQGAQWQPWLEAYLDSRSADSAQIAAGTRELWQHIAIPLERWVGPVGVSSLFDRCVDLNNSEFPWLPRSNQPFPADSIFPSVWHSLSMQPTATAHAASLGLFTTFFEVLTALIGQQLTAKVLAAAMADDGADADLDTDHDPDQDQNRENLP